MVRKLIVGYIKKFLPNRWFNILLVKPRLKFVDIHTAKYVDWVWGEVAQGVNSRGNIESYLRKQAHILEKGLQIPDREPGHSKGQYELVKKLLSKSQCQETNSWANEIITLYERVQKSEDISDAIYEDSPKAIINYDVFSQFSKSRRSIRFFKNEKISNEVLSDIAELINWAPNSCNRQNTKIYATQDNEKIKRCMLLNGGATCMNIPSHFICITSDTRSYMLPVERDAAYIDASLAAHNFILGLHSYGIGSCVLNWTHASQEQNLILKNELDIPNNEVVIFNMVIGYPDRYIKPSSKKSSAESIFFK